MRGDDAPSLEALYTQFAPMVFRRCHHLLGDQEEAADAMQDVFVSYCSRGEPAHTPGALLYVMATRHSLNRMRTRRRRPEHPMGQRVYDIAHRHNLAEQSIARQLLARLFGLQSQTGQTIATLYHLDGLTHQQIAEMMDLSVSTVRRHLSYPVEDLRVLGEEL